MTTELEVAKGYTRLDWYVELILQKIDDATSSVKQYMKDYMKVAEEEGISEDDAKKYLKTKIPHSTYYKYLPEEVNKRTYNKKQSDESTPVDNYVPEESSNVEDEAVPVDPKAILEFAREVKSENEENEYEEIIKDKDKAIEELRAENNVLKQRNPNNTPSLDARIQIANLEEANKKLQSELELAKRNQKEPEFTKASDIPVVPDVIPEPTPTKIRPFIIKKEEIPTFWGILGKSMNHDIQCFLCEDSWLYMLPPYQTTYSTDIQRDKAQKFELLTQEQGN